MHRIIRKKHGFTLVELLVVIAIMAILAAILIPSFSGYIDKAKNAQVYTEMRAVAVAAKAAHQDICIEFNISDASELYYGKLPSEVPRILAFQKRMKEYLNNESIMNNVDEVRVSASFLSIIYKMNGTKWYYVSELGKTEISTE